jgi:hypothetical protein
MSETPSTGDHGDWSRVGDAFASVAERLKELAQQSGTTATSEGSNVLDALRDGLGKAVETAKSATQDTAVVERLNAATSGLLDALSKELHLSRGGEAAAAPESGEVEGGSKPTA